MQPTGGKAAAFQIGKDVMCSDARQPGTTRRRSRPVGSTPFLGICFVSIRKKLSSGCLSYLEVFGAINQILYTGGRLYQCMPQQCRFWSTRNRLRLFPFPTICLPCRPRQPIHNGLSTTILQGEISCSANHRGIGMHIHIYRPP